MASRSFLRSFSAVETLLCRHYSVTKQINTRAFNQQYNLKRRLINPNNSGFVTNRLVSSTTTSTWDGSGDAQPGVPSSSSSNSSASSVDEDMKDIFIKIREELSGREPELCEVASYYFDGHGKAIRPMIAILMARAVNAHLRGESGSNLLPSQKQLALVSEMIHTATLVHDDVIDRSDKRRGKPSVNVKFGQRKSIVGGDYVLAKAGAMVARLDNNEVTEILAQVLEDLVHGEFMQLGANEENTERFAHYIGKTFNKTASLMAYTCKGVAILGGADETLKDKAFQFGKHLGIAFQLVDDLLDFVSSTDAMGKPVAADLQLGLATAPVLFAVQKFPELNPLIERRFSEPGDVAKALECVHKSDGLAETKFLAQKYCLEAVRYANHFRPSPFQSELVTITEKVLNRTK